MFRSLRRAALAACACLGLTGAPALAERPVILDMASTFPSDMPLVGEGGVQTVEKVRRVTGGEVVINFHAPGALVPAADTVKAVAAGKVDAAWAGAGWFAGIDPAFNMFSAVPFGPGIGEYMAWMYYGGGLEAARELFHAHGVHNVPCALIPPEASGWFRREIKTVADLKGLRMRFFGLGAKTVQKLGVATQQLPPDQILPALETNRIDAAEFSLPQMDRRFGFQNVAKYYYFPGWHQQATFFDLYVNKAKWDKLADRHKAAIELACSDTLRDSIARGESAQGRIIAELQREGVQVRRWSPQILAAFEKAWLEVVAEESTNSANFRRIYESYSRFRAEYAVWSYLGYMQ